MKLIKKPSSSPSAGHFGQKRKSSRQLPSLKIGLLLKQQLIFTKTCNKAEMKKSYL